MITIVSATPLTEGDFYSSSLLARSVAHLQRAGIHFDLRVTFQNPDSEGLSRIYNENLERDTTEYPMLLVHDDVFVHDILLEGKIEAALQSFDVVGVAGGDPPTASEGWYNPACGPSGAILHCDRGDPNSILHPSLDIYGPSPKNCSVIDGCFIAVRPSIIARAGVRFGLEFRLHHYDLDFCHSARAAGLRVGTWPISITHGSGGGYDKPSVVSNK